MQGNDCLLIIWQDKKQKPKHNRWTMCKYPASHPPQTQFAGGGGGGGGRGDRGPKISYTKFSVRMVYANSADLDQTDQGLHYLPFH